MSTTQALDLAFKYPIGKFSRVESLAPEARRQAIDQIANLPHALQAATSSLSESQLDTPYREGGWTVRQVVHHLADSHINAYSRFRLALTEEWPTIRPYREDLWAKLHDASTQPVSVSHELLTTLHQRWVVLLRSLAKTDWPRGYVHPDGGRWQLSEAVALYSWHGRHHTAHITELRKRNNW